MLIVDEEYAIIAFEDVFPKVYTQPVQTHSFHVNLHIGTARINAAMNGMHFENI